MDKESGLLGRDNLRLHLAFGVFLILPMVINLYRGFRFSVMPDMYNSFYYTEFMINYEGGFVRRGLLGQLLYRLCDATGWSPEYIIIPLALAACGFVLWFFFRRFHERHYCWWLLCSPLFCGHLIDVIRKDFILYAILIGICLLLASGRSDMLKRCVAMALMCLGLLLHEAFLFWGFPLYALLLFSDKSSRRINDALMIVAVLFTFGLMCLYKGDKTIACSIVESWNTIIAGSPMVYVDGISVAEEGNNSIQAIGWDSVETFIRHFRFNFKGVSDDGSSNWSPLFIRMAFMAAAYYFATNFLFVFRRKDSDLNEDDRTNLSSIFLITLVCLLPMFTILSIDYGRLYQYLFVVSFISLVIVPRQRFTLMIPKRIRAMAVRINSGMNRFLPPSKGLMIILLLFLAESPWMYNLDNAVRESIYGTYAYSIGHLLGHISEVLKTVCCL